jgi:hypothetical protein
MIFQKQKTPNPELSDFIQIRDKIVVHFLNKGGRRGRIPWRKSSWRGLGAGVAGAKDRRRRQFLEREKKRGRTKSPTKPV